MGPWGALPEVARAAMATGQAASGENQMWLLRISRQRIVLCEGELWPPRQRPLVLFRTARKDY